MAFDLLNARMKLYRAAQMVSNQNATEKIFTSKRKLPSTSAIRVFHHTYCNNITASEMDTLFMTDYFNQSKALLKLSFFLLVWRFFFVFCIVFKWLHCTLHTDTTSFWNNRDTLEWSLFLCSLSQHSFNCICGSECCCFNHFFAFWQEIVRVDSCAKNKYAMCRRVFLWLLRAWVQISC